MPEMPEIETVRRVIEPQIQGREVLFADVRRAEVVAHPTADEFCRRMSGQRFCALERRGKYLIFVMESGDRLLLHLRMTGCLLAAPGEREEKKHTHIVFGLEGGMELRFSDTRRFGRISLLEKGERCEELEKLGAEPCSPQITAEYLMSRFKKSRRAIKSCLLDQSVVAGIGNIYSDEILFAAELLPTQPANTLTEQQWQRLAAAIPERMSYFVEKNAIDPSEYLETGGEDYRNTPFLQVYGHEGEPCPRCGSLLCREVICGRSSVFCSSCQGSERLRG